MPRPNILWIVTTQWRTAGFGYAGDPNAHTPCLDRLAAQSVNYRQAVTPHPFGPFARAALLTGVPSPANGVRDYFDPLPVGARTIAHEMKELGYETAYFGKWHLARRDPAAALVGETHARTLVPPEARGGFEFWEGFEGGFLLNDPWLHGSGLEQPRQFSGYQSDVIGTRAAEWLSARTPPASTPAVTNSRPWFGVVSLEAPHPPYDAPAAGVIPRSPGEITLSPNVPRGGEVEAIARRDLAGYHAHIEATDRAIGRLLSAAGSETVVVFTSVHGDMHGAHGLFRKGWPHEESVRVPLLIRSPRRRAKGGISDDAVSLVDLPTMTRDLAGGLNLRTAPRHALISMPSVVALPHQCDRIWSGVRTPARKLILNADGSPWLFFDLASDPFEMKNLAADPAKAAEMKELAKLLG